MNPVTHFEIPYKNADRVQQFYETVFGWKTQNLGPEMNNYIVATTAETDVKPGSPAGSINGGFYPSSPESGAIHPSFVIGVKDINQHMELIRSNGGEILGEPHNIPGIGPFVGFKDTEGNRLSILQPMSM